MYIQCLSGILCLLMIGSANSISVATTSSPYTASPNDSPSYSSPSTQEPSSSEYKSASGGLLNTHGGGPFPYARQFFEPLFNPSAAHYSDGVLSSPKPYQLFHRLPFFPSTPYPNPIAEPTPYNLPGYASQPPYNLPGYGNQPASLFDTPYHPLSFAPPQKYGRNPYGSDCDFHPIASALRNPKPLQLFYPNKAADNYYDSSLSPAKGTNQFYNRFPTAFLPPYGGASYANNIYH